MTKERHRILIIYRIIAFSRVHIYTFTEKEKSFNGKTPHVSCPTIPTLQKAFLDGREQMFYDVLYTV